MRIAIASEVYLPKIDGITNRLRHTLPCLRRAGHELLLIAPDAAVASADGHALLRVPSLPFPPYPGLRIAAPDPRILSGLRSFRPDLLHAVGPVALGAWAMLAARALAVPVVASYHTDLARYARLHGYGWAEPLVWPLLRRLHSLAHLNLCPSESTRRELEQRGLGGVGLWSGGVDLERFHPRRRSESMRALLSGGWPEAPLVLCVGRLSPEKHFDRIGLVLEALPDAQVAVVGDGPARAALEAAFPADRVRFLGFLEGDELAIAYASADLLFMPSTTETLGFVVLEALASGVPVVAAKAGGVTDLVRHGENGWLFDPARPADAARGLCEVMRSGSGRALMGERARKSAEGKSWSRETALLLDAYRRAIAIASQTGLAGRAHRRLARAAMGNA